MSVEEYQRAKEIFTELVELPEEHWSQRLSELDVKSPDVAREVRSLLEYHTSQSLVVSPLGPKIRTRSTLSTTYQASSLSWLSKTLKPLAIALPMFVLAAIAAYWTQSRVAQSLKSNTAGYLNETVDFRVSEFRSWEKQQLTSVLGWSQNSEVIAPIRALVELTKQQSPDEPQLAQALGSAPHASRLGAQLRRLAGRPVKYAVWDRRMLTIADWAQNEKPECLGEFVTTGGATLLAPVLKGSAKMVLPNLGTTVTEGYELERGESVLSVFAPVFDDSGSVIAALMVRGFGLEEEYTGMLARWRSKPSSETYLLNSRSLMLTESRYGEQLESLPLAKETSSADALIYVRDPEINLLVDGRASKNSAASNPAAWNPTVLARQVTSGNDGIDAEGYRNYVGQEVIGAWRWLPDHQVGIAFEQDIDSTTEIAKFVGRMLAATSALFTIGLIAMAISVALGSLASSRIGQVGEAGPYQVQELIGEGGMGCVYLAEHALLCRQSAVKVLTKGINDLTVISRFEREVQLASQLTHPNTIAIYDFGRNKDGLFYYAMEYINGSHLGQLVEYAGPLHPGRCIYILRQLCRALLEAHQAGVVHRDIKPQNIMVCNRGGEPDFVKLFDYGLVKAFAPGVSQNQSQTKIVVGTPRFMAPERLSSPWLADPRVDIYSVGALAYFLLTGQLPPLVTMMDGMDHEQPGVETLDLPPSVVDFGGILSVCMAVEPSARPSSMSSLTRELDDLSKKFPWSRADSEQWWRQHEEKLLHLVRNKRKKLTSEKQKS